MLLSKSAQFWTIRYMYMYTHRGGVGTYSHVERFRTNTYMTYLAYTLFLTCIKHDMLLTCNMHVTCLLFTCYSHYMRCACYYYFNMHTTWILPLLQHACCLNMRHTWLLHSCYRHVWVNMHVRASNMHVTYTRFRIGCCKNVGDVEKLISFASRHFTRGTDHAFWLAMPINHTYSSYLLVVYADKTYSYVCPWPAMGTRRVCAL